MSTTKKTLRSPLAQARGLGSAKNGTHHWIAQRATALFLLPLIALLITSFVCQVIQGDYISTYNWLHQPLIGGFVLLFLIAGFYHGVLGMQVVIEDYIHAEHTKIFSLLVVKFFAALFFILGVIAVLRIQLTDVIPHV